jgi:hypothetical protein
VKGIFSAAQAAENAEKFTVRNFRGKLRAEGSRCPKVQWLSHLPLLQSGAINWSYLPYLFRRRCFSWYY